MLNFFMNFTYHFFAAHSRCTLSLPLLTITHDFDVITPRCALIYDTRYLTPCSKDDWYMRLFLISPAKALLRYAR